MRAKDFLSEFSTEHFPCELGPAISVDAHEPPFTMSQLRMMARQNLIVLNKEDTHYRLTLKAADLKDRMQSEAATVAASSTENPGQDTSPVEKQLSDLQKGDLVAVWYERGGVFEELRCEKVENRAPNEITVGVHQYNVQGRLMGPWRGTRIEVWDEATHRKVLEDQEQYKKQKPRLPRKQ